MLLQQLLDTAEPVHIPGLGVILTIIVLLLTGRAGRQHRRPRICRRLGIAAAPHSDRALDLLGAKNFAEIVFSDSSQSFKKVLLIEYPRKGLYSLAFQTSSNLGEVQGRTGEDVVCCFVPTTPNPTSGFIIIVPRKDVTVLDMDVDEALKMIMSLGVVVPTWRKGRTGELPFDAPDEPA